MENLDSIAKLLRVTEVFFNSSVPKGCPERLLNSVMISEIYYWTGNSFTIFFSINFLMF
jgi:hypothetical protein